MGKLSARRLETLPLRKGGRYGDGGGLFLRVIEPGRMMYWTYRYRLDERDREISIGSYPELSLDEAREKHLLLHNKVKRGLVDPVAERARDRELRRRKRERVEAAWLDPAQPNNKRRLTREEAPDLCHLYRHYDFDNRLIYIGVTNQVLRRWEKHKSTSSWADQIATITIEHYATRAEAEAAETEAILVERPRLNGHVLLNRWAREAARAAARRKPEAEAAE